MFESFTFLEISDTTPTTLGVIKKKSLWTLLQIFCNYDVKLVRFGRQISFNHISFAIDLHELNLQTGSLSNVILFDNIVGNLMFFIILQTC